MKTKTKHGDRGGLRRRRERKITKQADQIACFLGVYEVMAQGFKGGYLNPSFMAHMPHFMACGC